MKPVWRKAMSACLALIYLLTNVVLNSMAESNLWAERRSLAAQTSSSMIASLPALTNMSALSSARSVSVSKMPSKRWLALPNSLRRILDTISPAAGTIQDVYEGDPAKDPVVLIQDVHMNAEAQCNIAAVLQALINERQVDWVGVEGAFQKLPLAPLRALPDKKILNVVAKSLMDHDLLAATSFVGITSAVEPPPFVGIDDRIHYKANAQVYLGSQSRKSDAAKELTAQKQQLIEKQNQLRSSALRRFLNERNGYHGGQLNLGRYVNALMSYGLPADKSIAQFADAYTLETHLDFARAETERARVLEKLASALTKHEAADFMSQSLAYRSGQLSFGDYYREFHSVCQRKGIDLRATPAFERYVRYVLLSDTLRADTLFESLQRLEDRIVDRLAATPTEKQIAALSEHLLLTEKLLEFSLTPQEWARYRSFRKRLEVSSSLEPFESFYLEADIRSGLMLKPVLESRDNKTRALVIGGFHAPDIAQKLREQKISYVVVTPKITKITNTTGTSYLSVFAREKTSLDRLFTGSKLFLKPLTDVDYRPLYARIWFSYWARTKLLMTGGKTPLKNIFGVGPSDVQVNVRNPMDASLDDISFSWLGLLIHAGGINFLETMAIEKLVIAYVFAEYSIHWAGILTVLVLFMVHAVVIGARYWSTGKKVNKLDLAIKATILVLLLGAFTAPIAYDAANSFEISFWRHFFWNTLVWSLRRLEVVVPSIHVIVKKVPMASVVDRSQSASHSKVLGVKDLIDRAIDLMSGPASHLAIQFINVDQVDSSATISVDKDDKSKMLPLLLLMRELLLNGLDHRNGKDVVIKTENGGSVSSPVWKIIIQNQSPIDYHQLTKRVTEAIAERLLFFDAASNHLYIKTEYNDSVAAESPRPEAITTMGRFSEILSSLGGSEEIPFIQGLTQWSELGQDRFGGQGQGLYVARRNAARSGLKLSLTTNSAQTQVTLEPISNIKAEDTLKHSIAQLLEDKYEFDPDKAKELADLIRNSAIWSVINKNEKVVFNDGRMLAKIQPLGSVRYFDLNGRWILTVDPFGNAIDQLKWDDSGKFEKATLWNIDRDLYTMEPNRQISKVRPELGPVYFVYPAGMADQVRKRKFPLGGPIFFYEGINFTDHPELIPGSGTIPHNPIVVGLNYSVLSVVAYLAQDRNRKLRYIGNVPTDMLNRALSEIAVPDSDDYSDAMWDPIPPERVFNPNGVFVSVRHDVEGSRVERVLMDGQSFRVNQIRSDGALFRFLTKDSVLQNVRLDLMGTVISKATSDEDGDTGSQVDISGGHFTIYRDHYNRVSQERGWFVGEVLEPLRLEMWPALLASFTPLVLVSIEGLPKALSPPVSAVLVGLAMLYWLARHHDQLKTNRDPWIIFGLSIWSLGFVSWLQPDGVWLVTVLIASAAVPMMAVNALRFGNLKNRDSIFSRNFSVSWAGLLFHGGLVNFLETVAVQKLVGLYVISGFSNGAVMFSTGLVMAILHVLFMYTRNAMAGQKTNLRVESFRALIRLMLFGTFAAPFANNVESAFQISFGVHAAWNGFVWALRKGTQRFPALNRLAWLIPMVSVGDSSGQPPVNPEEAKNILLSGSIMGRASSVFMKSGVFKKVSFAQIPDGGQTILTPKSILRIDDSTGSVFKSWRSGVPRELWKKWLADYTYTRDYLEGDWLFNEFIAYQYGAIQELSDAGLAPQFQSFGLHYDEKDSSFRFYIQLQSLPNSKDLSTAAEFLSLRERIEVLDQVARAIEILHKSNAIHCDIKPQNILVQKRPGQPIRAMLIDFGIALDLYNSTKIDTARYESAEWHDQGPFGWSTYGTEGYMPDHSWRSKSTDLYAFAKTIKNVLTPEDLERVPELASLVSRIIKGPTINDHAAEDLKALQSEFAKMVNPIGSDDVAPHIGKKSVADVSTPQHEKNMEPGVQSLVNRVIDDVPSPQLETPVHFPGDLPNIFDEGIMVMDPHAAVVTHDIGQSAYSVAYRSDGKVLAVGGENALILINPEERREITRLPVDGQLVLSVAFSPNGRLLVAGTKDGKIRFWQTSDLDQGITAPFYETDRTGYTTRSIAFDPDGNTVAVGTENGILHLFGVTDGNFVRTIATMTMGKAVRAVAFSRDGKFAASSGRKILIWPNIQALTAPSGVTTLAVRATAVELESFDDDPTEQNKPIQGLSFNSDGTILASVALRGSVRMWDVSNPHQPKPRGMIRRGQYFSVTFSPHNPYILFTGGMGEVGYWGVETKGIRRVPAFVFNEQPAWNALPVFSLAIRPDGKAVVSGGPRGDTSRDTRTVREWLLPTRKTSGPFPAGGASVPIASENHNILDLSRPISVQEVPLGSINAIQYVQNGNVVGIEQPIASDQHYYGPRPNTARLRVLHHGAQARMGAEVESLISWTLSPDGTKAAALAGVEGGRYHGRLNIFDLSGEHEEPIIRMDLTDGAALAFSPDSKCLAVFRSEGRIELIYLNNETDPSRYASYTFRQYEYDEVIRELFQATAVAFGDNGKTLLAVDHLGSVLLWDVSHGTDIPLAQLYSNRKGYDVQCTTAFSGDTKTVVMGFHDGSIELCDLRNPNNLRRLTLVNAPLDQNRSPLTDNPHTIKSLALDPSGRVLVSIDAQHARVWDVSDPDQGAKLLFTSVAGSWENATFLPNGSEVLIVGDEISLHLQIPTTAEENESSMIEWIQQLQLAAQPPSQGGHFTKYRPLYHRLAQQHGWFVGHMLAPFVIEMWPTLFAAWTPLLPNAMAGLPTGLSPPLSATLTGFIVLCWFIRHADQLKTNRDPWIIFGLSILSLGVVSWLQPQGMWLVTALIASVTVPMMAVNAWRFGRKDGSGWITVHYDSQIGRYEDRGSGFQRVPDSDRDWNKELHELDLLATKVKKKIERSRKFVSADSTDLQRLADNIQALIERIHNHLHDNPAAWAMWHALRVRRADETRTQIDSHQPKTLHIATSNSNGFGTFGSAHLLASSLSNQGPFQIVMTVSGFDDWMKGDISGNSQLRIDDHLETQSPLTINAHYGDRDEPGYIRISPPQAIEHTARAFEPNHWLGFVGTNLGNFLGLLIMDPTLRDRRAQRNQWKPTELAERRQQWFDALDSVAAREILDQQLDRTAFFSAPWIWAYVQDFPRLIEELEIMIDRSHRAFGNQHPYVHMVPGDVVSQYHFIQAARHLNIKFIDTSTGKTYDTPEPPNLTVLIYPRLTNGHVRTLLAELIGTLEKVDGRFLLPLAIVTGCASWMEALSAGCVTAHDLYDTRPGQKRPTLVAVAKRIASVLMNDRHPLHLEADQLDDWEQEMEFVSVVGQIASSLTAGAIDRMTIYQDPVTATVAAERISNILFGFNIVDDLLALLVSLQNNRSPVPSVKPLSHRSREVVSAADMNTLRFHKGEFASVAPPVQKLNVSSIAGRSELAARSIDESTYSVLLVDNVLLDSLTVSALEMLVAKRGDTNGPNVLICPRDESVYHEINRRLGHVDDRAAALVLTPQASANLFVNEQNDSSTTIDVHSLVTLVSAHRNVGVANALQDVCLITSPNARFHFRDEAEQKLLGGLIRAAAVGLNSAVLAALSTLRAA